MDDTRITKQVLQYKKKWEKRFWATKETMEHSEAVTGHCTNP
jgi:hypothetical protein